MALKKKHKKKIIALAVAVIAIIIAGGSREEVLEAFMMLDPDYQTGQTQQGQSKEASIAEGTYQVKRVVDGDTLVLAINGVDEKIRLIGVDTPESVHSNKDKNVPYGKIASKFTTDMLEGNDIQLELDVQERDKYGRVLAYVYIDGEMFNKTLLKEGHAKVATYPPNVKYVEDFTALQEEARNSEKGMWFESKETEQ